MSKLSLLYASKRKIRFTTFGWQGQVCYARHHFDEKLSKAYAENCLKARPLFQNCEQKIKFVRGSVSPKCNIFGIINQNKKQNRTKQKKSWLALFPKLIHPHPSENGTLPKNLQCLFWPLLEFLKAISLEKRFIHLKKDKLLILHYANLQLQNDNLSVSFGYPVCLQVHGQSLIGHSLMTGCYL